MLASAAGTRDLITLVRTTTPCFTTAGLCHLRGDLSAHPLVPSRKAYVAAYHITKIAPLNTHDPNSSFAAEALMGRIRWCVDETATSDHYATLTILLDACPDPMPQHDSKWEVEKSTWQDAFAPLHKMQRTSTK